MKKHLILLSLLLCAVMVVAQQPVPQPPQTYIDTTFAMPTGVTWQAHTSAALQSALNSANPGDVIVLDAGVTYQGNFTLPAKSNSNKQWIYIVGSSMSSLPAPGTRINPATDAAAMPKIVTPNATAALTLNPGANHYRFVGLEIFTRSNYGCNKTASPPVNCFSNQLVFANSTPGKPLVDSITVDRSYIHGSPTQDVKQGVMANGSNFAVVDSYISDIHQSTHDSQAIVAYYSPGPIKIVNNFLSATTEDVMFGGAGGYSNPWVPSDIEIRNNHFFKPLSWAQPGVTLAPKNQWVVKNNLEFKSARRVTVDSNVLENVWVNGQMGFSVMITPRPSSSGSNAVVDDVLFTNNVLKNVSSGVDTAGYDNGCLAANGCTKVGETRRVVFRNNLILLGDTTQPGYTNGYSYGGIILPRVADFVVQHNTVVPPPNMSYCKGSWNFDTSGTGSATPPSSRTNNVWMLDNALCRQINGPYGYVGQFPYVLTDYMGDPSPADQRFVGNIFYAPTGDKVYSLPVQNYVSTVPITYVDPASGNYQLSAPAWTSTSDGQISGVDSSTLP